MMRGYGLGYWDEYDVATRRTARESLACAYWTAGILDARRLEETGEVEMARHICMALSPQQVGQFRPGNLKIGVEDGSKSQ
jgi:hypothetical protein